MGSARKDGTIVVHRLRYLRYLIAGVALLVLSLAMSGNGLASAFEQPSRDGLWRDVTQSAIPAKGNREIVPQAYRTVAVDMKALRSLLASAPLEANTSVRDSQAVIRLPMPDGTYGRFQFVEAPVMEAPLAAQFPSIKTYLGQGLDDPTASVRFDLTPHGFHALVLSASDTVFIDPYQRGDTTHYVSYFMDDYSADAKSLMVETGVDTSVAQPEVEGPMPPSGPQLRTYRIAIASTGEYTIFHGGTVELGLAAIVTSLNRVDGVYEREVAVRMVLVANNNAIVYTDPLTDPYTNNNGFTMLGQNQTNLDLVIGNANYDIGHVFSTGGGGVAGLRVVCATGSKARGVTGSPNPIGDPFDIDYVAHEMGHQFGGNHTFNSTASSCGGGNRSAAHAYEPGSGSTIMAYAGICGAENLQPNSDPFFHVESYDEIVAYTTVGNGNTCPVITNTGNNAPTVDAGPSYNVPNHTPLKLTAIGSDPNGDPLTYNWEQYNLGAPSPPMTDDGTRPIFRSFVPATVPYRYLPRMTDILSNTLTIGEAWATTNRTLTFRVTARDNRAGGGGVNNSQVTHNVTTSSGPFQVTAPNTPVTWPADSTQAVTWDVANTTAAPVSCPNVDVLLSTDGGGSFPTTLLNDTPNDGTQNVTVPNSPTTQGRVMVMCSNNIFFDVSNTNFTISAGGATPTATSTPGATNTVGATATRTPTVGVPTATPTACVSQQVIVDGSFEAGVPNPNWDEGSTNFGTPICDVPTCGTGGGTAGPRTGAWWTWFGGVQAVEDAFVAQTVNIPAGAQATLQFYLWIGAHSGGGTSDYLRVTVGGAEVFRATDANTQYDAGYTLVSINVSAQAGGSRVVRFESHNGTTGVININVDDVSLTLGCPACGEFTDVPPSNTFYPFVHCLACEGIIQGYSDGTFRPNNPVTRGQISKIISLSAGFVEPVPTTQQSFEDVPYGSTFWEYVERLSTRGIIGGYACGGPGEPCVPPGNRPYFRPNAGATRGQLVKIASESAGFTDTIPPTQYTFADVPPGHTFWLYIERLLLNRPGAISGYACGGPGEPCDAQNRPYFRPNNGVTRGQSSKIVANTFFPGCSLK
jgi:hypothetical protein